MSQPSSSNRTPESHSLWGAALLSAMVHAAALAAAFIIWPKLAPPVLLPSDIVPVELEFAENTNVMAQEQAPEPPPEPQALPMPEIPEPQMQVPEPPPPPEADDEVALEEEKAPPPEETKPQEQRRFAMAVPRAKPKPEKKKEEFDIDKIASLVDKIDRQAPKTDTKAAPPQARHSTQGAGAQTAMTASELDALKGQLKKCWNVPVGAPDPAALVFRIRIFLNQDGSVAAAPELIDQGSLGDPYFRAAVDSAKRAVHMCSPFKLPPEKFATWNDITITFDPTKMSGY